MENLDETLDKMVDHLVAYDEIPFLDLVQFVWRLNRLTGETNGLLYSDAAEWDVDWVNTLFAKTDAIPSFHIVSVYDLMSDAQAQRFNEYKTALAQSGDYKQHRAKDDLEMIGKAVRAIVVE